MAKMVSFGSPNEERLRRQQMMAQQMMQQPSGPPPSWQGMPVMPQYGLGQGLADAGSKLVGALMMRKADQGLQGIDEQKRKALAQQLMGQEGQPGFQGPPDPRREQAVQTIMGLPIEVAQQIAAQQAMQTISPPPPERTVLNEGAQVWEGNRMVAENPREFAPPAPRAPEDLVMVAGPDGNPVYKPKSEAAGMPAYVKPETPSEPRRDPLVEVVGPDGQPQLLPESQAVGMRPFQKPTGGLSPRDANTARNKMTQLALARQQLADVKAKYDALKGSHTGPLAGRIPTADGEAFDTAVNSMRDTITAITRTPGVGAMSDFETRLNQAKIPDRTLWHHDSIKQQIDSLEQIVSVLEQGYGSTLQEAGALSEQPQQGPQMGVGPGPWRQQPTQASANGAIDWNQL
jgi:hypothetical protein